VSHWQQPQPLDRCEDRRGDPGWVAEAWSHRLAHVIGVDADGKLAASAEHLAMPSPDGAYDLERHHLLGMVGEAPVFATLISAGDLGLRAVMDTLPTDELQLAFAAAGLIGWHQRAGFCPNCGSVTHPVSGGLARRCPACEREDYPRSDAAVIVAITDADGRLLLARQPVWPARRFSVLAGFAEVGESLEQVVHREVHEEVGLELRGVRYLGSQPWPFPRSLMVAFAATAVGTQLRPAVGEIEDAAWFSRTELHDAVEAGTVLLPARTSIAWRMIRAWLDDNLNAESVG
jgi:NAD+ diphosphatase